MEMASPLNRQISETLKHGIDLRPVDLRWRDVDFGGKVGIGIVVDIIGILRDRCVAGFEFGPMKVVALIRIRIAPHSAARFHVVEPTGRKSTSSPSATASMNEPSNPLDLPMLRAQGHDLHILPVVSDADVTLLADRVGDLIVELPRDVAHDAPLFIRDGGRLYRHSPATVGVL